MTRRARVLTIVATDNTFEKQAARGETVWVGKCIHCRARLVVALDGTLYPGVTVEHIVPKNHGGTDEAENLALACARCNASKGYRLDDRPAADPKLQEVIETLSRRRRQRWRHE